MTIGFDSNYFITIICTKYFCVPSFMQNKPSLNDFMRESAKKALKTLKTQLKTQFQAYDFFFDSKKPKTIIYTK